MESTSIKGKKNRLILRRTFFLDELSILIAFFLAIAIRYDAILKWVDYNKGIYISMVVTVLLFYVIVFFLYDMRRKNIILLDPVENLLKLCKSRFLLAMMTIVYFYVAQKSVLASRIVMALFLVLSVFFGYILRMIYRHCYIAKHGIPGMVRVYEIHMTPDDSWSEESTRDEIKKIKAGDYDHALVVKGKASDDSVKSLLKALESEGIRSYLSIDSMGYEIRTGIVSDIDSYVAIPAFVRKDRVNIFGVNYCISRTEEAVRHVLGHLNELKGQYICFSNVHTTVMAKEKPEYARVLNEAALVFPDGTPIAKIENKRGYEGAERVAGPDFMEHMFRDTADGKVAHYFYGSSEETLKALKENLLMKYPGLNICGMYSPPFRALSPNEDDQHIEQINNSGADIVWVGLGAPKQEQWMNAHKDRIAGVMMGVGAGFDFHAGTIQRAPKWLQKIGLEWLYRLTRDPKRLFKRYLVTNTKFFWYLFRE